MGQAAPADGAQCAQSPEEVREIVDQLGLSPPYILVPSYSFTPRRVHIVAEDKDWEERVEEALIMSPIHEVRVIKDESA
jgi:carbamoylphosphate synthase large subunit